MATLTQDEIEAYLGRSLSTIEADNLDLYLTIAITRLLDLLCLKELPEPIPADLALVLSRLFGLIQEENGQTFGVEEKKVEDFTIRFDTDGDSLQTRWYNANLQTLNKYSECNAEIIHGKTIYDSGRCCKWWGGVC